MFKKSSVGTAARALFAFLIKTLGRCQGECSEMPTKRHTSPTALGGRSVLTIGFTRDVPAATQVYVGQ